MIELAENQQMNTMVSEVTIFDDIPAALQRLSERRMRGKIVARVDS